MRLSESGDKFLSRFASKSDLEEVSTTCDSGWVRSPLSSRPQLRTHPLSQVVLTSSKLNCRIAHHGDTEDAEVAQKRKSLQK